MSIGTGHTSIDGSQKIRVGSLPQEATNVDLEAHFSQLGQPVLCVVTKPGQGCVAYATSEEAESAAEAFNGSEVGGMAIKTSVWNKKMGGGKGDLDGGKSSGAWKGGAWGKSGGKGMPPWMMMKGMDPWTLIQMKGKKGMMMKGLMMKGMGKGKKGWGSYDNGGGWQDDWSSKKSGPSEAVTVHKLSVSPASIIQQGYPAEAPAVEYEKGVSLFGNSGHILKELVANVDADVEVIHDADWEQFPEIAEAWKSAGGEENCVAVALAPSVGLWGIGVAAGWKGRESAARLALAMAVLQADSSATGKVKQHYPDFVALCRQVKKSGSAGGGTVYASSGNGPPMMDISVPPTCAIVTAGLPAEGIAIEHEGKEAKTWFSNAHSLLAELVEDVTTEVEFEDDPDANTIPEVMQAWVTAGGQENCACIAKHAGTGLWGAGLAYGWKARESAAKLALAIAMAKSSGKLDELVARRADYPELGELVTSLSNGEGVRAAKRRKKY